MLRLSNSERLTESYTEDSMFFSYQVCKGTRQTFTELELHVFNTNGFLPSPTSVQHIHVDLSYLELEYVVTFIASAQRTEHSRSSGSAPKLWLECDEDRVPGCPPQ